jgi:hypothetical protein
MYATIFFGLLILLTYPAMNKMTSVLRNVFWTDLTEQTNSVNQKNLLEKLETEYQEYGSSGRQYTWIRINYTSQQAFAIEQYDLGLPGKSFETAKWAFIPRLLYPNKPIITLGENFTKLATGRENVGGGTGPGAFAEGYWNKGWLGVVIVCSILGFLISVGTQFSNAVIVSNAYHYFPLTIIILKVGYRIDDWFIATSINSIPMVIFSLIIIVTIGNYLKSQSMKNNRDT